MNDWVDVHCFFTMGRSILDGLVPYADLYEQKGPVLYFLYAIVSIFSRDSFFGVFILEVVCFALFLYFSGKIAQLYLGKSKVVYLITALLAAVIPVSWSFSHGSSVEEMCLFMMAYGLFSTLRALQEGRFLSFREAFLNGVFAAMILWIKYTMLGFYLGLATFVILWYLLPQLRWKELLITIGQFLLGIAAVSAVVLVYFLINRAVDDLFTVYFYNNIFLYPSELEGSRVDLIWKCFYNAMKYNPSFSWWLGIGLVGLIAGLFRSGKSALMIIMCFMGLAVGTYWGGKGFDYYGLVFAAFSVFGPITIILVARLCKLPELAQQLFRGEKLVGWIATAVCTAMLLAHSYTNCDNVYLMQYDKEDMPQYQFAQTIATVEDATLLNYGFLDGGFYFAAESVPECKYFCYFNINTQEMWDMQKDCIENGKVDFIVTRRYPLDRYSPNASLYTLVDEATFYFSGTDYTYYLYQKLPGA